MAEHDWLCTQLLNVASWPALREGNGDKVESEPAIWRVKLLSFMDLSVWTCIICVCLHVTWETKSTESRLSGGSSARPDVMNVNSYPIECAWWTACSEAPSVTTLSCGRLWQLYLFYVRALPRTGTDWFQTLIPHRHTEALYVTLVGQTALPTEKIFL